MPRRARYLVPRGLPRRDEILAVCVVLVILAHVLFAQLTIILAAVFYLITKMTRWRLSWLMVPAAVGLAGTREGRPRGLRRGGRPRGRGRRIRRRTRSDRGLPGRQRSPGRSHAALRRRVHRDRDL